MPLVKAQCTNCGAALEVDSSKDAAICPYCNTPYIVEKAINNYTTNITNHIHAQTLNIINQKEDFEIIAGVLKKYTGKSRSAVIPNDVVVIGERAFSGCLGLTEVIIPESVKIIQGYAFENCSSMTGIKIPNSIIEIGNMAFYCCTELVDIFYDGTKKQWNEIKMKTINPNMSYYIHCTDGIIHHFVL